MESGPMQSFVIGLSSQRMYRDLFWLQARIAPLVLCAFLVLLAVPRYRRRAAWALLTCAAGAVLVAVVFHTNYALAIWAGHVSAIQYLDRVALLAGFGASAVAYAAGLAVFTAARRIALR